MFEITSADLNAHDPLQDPVARPTERGEIFSETMLDTNDAILNTGAPTCQYPSIGSFYTPDVTIVHGSLQEMFKWLLCDYLSSDHRPISIILSFTNQGMKPLKLFCSPIIFKCNVELLSFRYYCMNA